MKVSEALVIIGGVSHPSKMPCKSYSIPAQNCHVGSKLVGVKGSVCEGCYALKGNYTRYPQVNVALKRRLATIYKQEWVNAMVVAINKDKWFRWHDSGDIQSIMHLCNIMEVANRTPDCIHWIPTREYGFVRDYVESGKVVPSNMVVRLSALMVDGNPPISLATYLNTFDNVKGFIGVSSVSKKEYDCPAYEQDGKCKDCRTCWGDEKMNVTYKWH